MAESTEAKEAREAWEVARAKMEASETPAAREAERSAWHEYLRVSDPFALEDYEEG